MGLEIVTLSVIIIGDSVAETMMESQLTTHWRASVVAATAYLA